MGGVVVEGGGPGHAGGEGGELDGKWEGANGELRRVGADPGGGEAGDEVRGGDGGKHGVEVGRGVAEVAAGTTGSKDGVDHAGGFGTVNDGGVAEGCEESEIEAATEAGMVAASDNDVMVFGESLGVPGGGEEAGVGKEADVEVGAGGGVWSVEERGGALDVELNAWGDGSDRGEERREDLGFGEIRQAEAEGVAGGGEIEIRSGAGEGVAERGEAFEDGGGEGGGTGSGRHFTLTAEEEGIVEERAQAGEGGTGGGLAEAEGAGGAADVALAVEGFKDEEEVEVEAVDIHGMNNCSSYYAWH